MMRNVIVGDGVGGWRGGNGVDVISFATDRFVLEPMDEQYLESEGDIEFGSTFDVGLCA